MRRLTRFIRRIWPRRLPIDSPGVASVPREALFAEAFGHFLLCGLPAAEAIFQTSEILPGRRFREAVTAMGRHFRCGYSLEVSLRKTELPVDPGLLAALASGEEMGPLADMMFLYSRSAVAGDRRVLHRAFGRTAAAAMFASALAHLLGDRTLGLDEIIVAGRVCVGRFPEFTPDTLQRIHDDIMNGVTLAETLRRIPHLFDPMFVRSVAVCETRPALRAALQRLGQSP
jgi:type II secretory pathway component PulF